MGFSHVGIDLPLGHSFISIGKRFVSPLDKVKWALTGSYSLSSLRDHESKVEVEKVRLLVPWSPVFSIRLL